MDVNSGVPFVDGKYGSNQLNRSTSAPPHSPATIIKYIQPRVVGPNLSNSFQGSLRATAWSNVSSNFQTTAKTASHGLATLIQSSTFSTLSPLHSINGERMIDEHRDLSKVTETLTNAIMQCSNLEAHNGAQELQIEWLEAHRQQNSLTIEKMFRTEMDSAQVLIKESLHKKPLLETKSNEMEKKTAAHDEQYQQLLAKRNALSKVLFDFERQIAQNAAESQFLHRQIYNLDDESKFYRLKNHSLHARKVRLRYELDEEIFSGQSLKIELEVLVGEKITNEDIHSTSIDEVHNSLDLSQVAGMQPSKYYSEQLNQQVQRMRTEYEKKTEVHREELHRNFELELHRYHMEKSRPVVGVSREHEFILEQYQHEKKDAIQQIASIRGRIDETIIQIETMEKQLILVKNDESSILNARRHLSMLNQLIEEREQRLNESVRIRTSLKQEIENYKEQLNRHSRQTTQDNFKKRASIEIINQSFTSSNSSKRLSLQELRSENIEQHSPSIPRLPPTIAQSASPQQRPKRSSIIKIEELWDEGTLTGFTDFNIDQDCEILHRILNESNIDEVAIIRIFCNRSVGQRQQIRDKYRNLFNRNLGNDLEFITNGSLNKLLRVMLLSSIERDCYELRRILKEATIDESILAEIFFSRSNKHIQTVRDNYPKLFKNTLEQDIIGDRDNHSKRIFLALLQSNRPDNNDVDDNEVLKDARNLFETGAKWRIDGSTFLRLLCTRSNTQLKQIFGAYEQFSKVDIEQAIKVHIDGTLYYTIMAIVRIIRNRARFFAYGLKRCLRGSNTNEDNLNRIIVTRCEIDMVQIKNEYERITKRTLYDHIQTDINGNYKRALIELLRQRIEPNTNELTSQQANEQTVMSNRQNSERPAVQWREPISRVSSDRFVRRRSNDRIVNEKTRNDDNQSMTNHLNGQFDRNNQGKNNSLLTIHTKSTKSQYINRRSFEPMPTTAENHSELNDDQE